MEDPNNLLSTAEDLALVANKARLFVALPFTSPSVPREKVKSPPTALFLGRVSFLPRASSLPSLPVSSSRSFFSRSRNHVSFFLFFLALVVFFTNPKSNATQHPVSFIPRYFFFFFFLLCFHGFEGISVRVLISSRSIECIYIYIYILLSLLLEREKS